MTKVVVVNGPNLGRLGVRQPDVYGKQDLETLRKLCTEWGHELGLDVEVRQSDDEAEMIHWMHQAADEKTPIVMNPAASGAWPSGEEPLPSSGVPSPFSTVSLPRWPRATAAAKA